MEEREGGHAGGHAAASHGGPNERGDLGRLHVAKAIQAELVLLQLVQQIQAERVSKLAQRVLVRPQPELECLLPTPKRQRRVTDFAERALRFFRLALTPHPLDVLLFKEGEGRPTSHSSDEHSVDVKRPILATHLVSASLPPPFGCCAVPRPRHGDIRRKTLAAVENTWKLQRNRK